MDNVSFADISTVACGTMSLELAALKDEGFLDKPQILYTTPGLHQDIPEGLIFSANRILERSGLFLHPVFPSVSDVNLL